MQDCVEPTRRGQTFCVTHDPSGTGPSRSGALDAERKRGRITTFVVVVVAGVLAVVGVRACTALTSSSPPGNSPSGVACATSNLSSDAGAFLGSNFGDDPRWAVVSSVEVKSGVLWMYTSLTPSETTTATEVCGLGSAWAYGDPQAVEQGVWGVSVRAADGQRMVQREGVSDSCY